VGMPATFELLQQHLTDALRIDLFPSTRAVVLVIPFSELRHECTESEWRELQVGLAAKGIRTTRRRWWQFWIR